MMSFKTAPVSSTDPVAGPRPLRSSAASSSFAIGTGTFVVALAAVVGFMLDAPPQASPEIGAGWHLRGALGAAAPRIGRA